MATCVFSHVDEALGTGDERAVRTEDPSSKMFTRCDVMTRRFGIDARTKLWLRETRDAMVDQN